MTDIRITIDDTRAQNDLAALALKIPQLALMPLHRSAQWIAGQAQKKYLRGPRPKYLAVLSGRLLGSVSAKTAIEGKDVVGHIGTNVKARSGFNYPGWWEEKGPKSMGPRPWLAPARDTDRSKWQRIFHKEFQARLKTWVMQRGSV